MAHILALETSGTMCSVALFRGETLLSVTSMQGEHVHSRNLFGLIQEVLGESRLRIGDIQALALSSGPGSYTGLRIACSAVKGMAYAGDLPVICINSLEIQCRGFLHSLQTELEDGARIGVFLDARRNEVFAAFFDKEAKLLGEPAPYILDILAPPVPPGGSKLFLVGNGTCKVQSFPAYADAEFISGNAFLNARYMGKAADVRYHKGQFADLAYFEPDYLKPFFYQAPKTGK